MPAFAEASADVLWPLKLFYQWNREPVPEYEAVEGALIPEPYRQLLVHNQDMTPTLQEFHEDHLHLRVLHLDIDDDILTRFVILKTDGGERPVEFGAIQIDVGLLDTVPRCLVMEGHKPFGGILYTYDVPHTSQPSMFFQVDADKRVQEAFETDYADRVYGRCNTISLPSGDPLAYVVEILPPESVKQTGGC